MYVILAQATATSEHPEHPAGEIHSALLFVTASAPEEAGRTAVAELEGAGWSDARLHKIGEIDPMLMSGKDAAIESAYEAAVAEGASMIIYREADDGYAG